MTGKHKTTVAVCAVFLIAAFIVLNIPERFVDRGAADANNGWKTDAPDFVLNDLQGREFKLSDQRGKPVLLIFGTTWCPACRDEIPRLKDIHSRYAKRGLVMANIDIQQTRDTVSRFADRYLLPYPVLLDEDAHVSRAYGIRGVPTLILLDREGRIAGDQRFIDQMLVKMLKGKELSMRTSSLKRTI